MIYNRLDGKKKYTGGYMALYSWFIRTTTRPRLKSINNEQLKASQSVQNIENYTMWPTAKIKPNAKVTCQQNRINGENSPKILNERPTVVLPANCVIPVIKS